MGKNVSSDNRNYNIRSSSRLNDALKSVSISQTEKQIDNESDSEIQITDQKKASNYQKDDRKIQGAPAKNQKGIKNSKRGETTTQRGGTRSQVVRKKKAKELESVESDDNELIDPEDINA